MAYITVAEYMVYAWVSSLSTDETARVTALILSTKATMDGLIGDLVVKTKTEEIKYCDMVNNKGSYTTIICSNIEITALTKVNWIAYTWVLDTDYQITRPHNSRIVLKDISTYISGLTFDFFDIEYTSWYVVIPEDIKYLQYLLIAGEMSKQDWKDVIEYKAWPRTVKFSSEKDITILNSTINKYALIYI